MSGKSEMTVGRLKQLLTQHPDHLVVKMARDSDGTSFKDIDYVAPGVLEGQELSEPSGSEERNTLALFPPEEG